MTAKRRHWKEKNGRFYARIAVPKALQSTLGKTELIEALGGELRIADRNHAAAVAMLQAQIEQSKHSFQAVTPPAKPDELYREITVADFHNAVWDHYNNTLRSDELKRAAMPTLDQISVEYERVLKKIEAGEVDAGSDDIGVFNASTDYELAAGASHFYEQNRIRRLAALRSSIRSGDTRFIDTIVESYLADQKLIVEPGSTEWRELAHMLMRAEIEALKRTLEHDHGEFGGVPSDPIVKPPASPVEAHKPVPLRKLFNNYISTRQAIGKHRDGGANWNSVIVSLIKFLGHDDARKITKRNLLDWRDSLMASGKAAKTVSAKHLAAISAVLKWAFENDHLPTNEAQTVRQEAPRSARPRERGYTTVEAVEVLKASFSHKPAEAANPSNRESAHITAAKRWVPLLCAFTGARVSEMTQLRKEDVRKEEERWIVRISPDAGSVKTGQYRDVPLHKQLIELGFINFVEAAPQGPLFHSANTPDKYLAGARATAGKISQWLNKLMIVPAGVQPSHGWRHRFKTQGREIGTSDRVLDAIQGHTERTASDSYGDVTIAAKLKAIDALEHYNLTEHAT